MKKKNYPPRGDTQYKNILNFGLIKKILLQTLVEIIFRHHYIFLEFWDPLPYKQNEEK